jgi:hypothetical protein
LNAYLIQPISGANRHRCMDLPSTGDHHCCRFRAMPVRHVVLARYLLGKCCAVLQGALGTWRSQCSARTLSRDHAALEAGTSSLVNRRGRGVCRSVLKLRRESGKTHEGKPRSEPDWGNPTVRDRRGGLRNRRVNGSRTEAQRETVGQATGPCRHVRAALLSRPMRDDHF